jgi:hypothetical protein
MIRHAAFWQEFTHIQECLWRQAWIVHPNYRRGRYDGWVLCPRAHAEAHLRCIIESQASYPGVPAMSVLKEQFTQVQRYFPGDDLVFAVGDTQ